MVSRRALTLAGVSGFLLLAALFTLPADSFSSPFEGRQLAVKNWWQRRAVWRRRYFRQQQMMQPAEADVVASERAAEADVVASERAAEADVVTSERATAMNLSLIHISEPTRPY